MANEKKDGSSFTTNLPVIFLLLAVAGNLFWTQSPLLSWRPPETSPVETEGTAEQTVQARLWQDPFAAIGTKNDGKGAYSPVSELSWQKSEHKDAKTKTILAVMVTGSPYAEGREWRIRSRFAILAGLARSGFVPCDRDHLGWFQYRPSLMNNVLSCTNCDIPFEWFKQSITNSSSNHNDALVLWLKEEAFEKKPLRGIAQLIKDEKIENAQIKIIGPEQSSTLRAIWEDELNSSDGVGSYIDCLKGAEIYSTSATLADWRLFRQDPNKVKAEPRTRLKEALADCNVSFHNYICTDDALADVLVHELALRGVNWNNEVSLFKKPYHVALLSEWDTTYGRSLPESFTNAVAKSGGTISQIEQFTYLQGLDGQMTQDSRVQAALAKFESASAEQQQSKEEKMDILELQKPEGDSQLDYIPRLATTLREKEREWKKKGERLDAIGVLGSDVYDKLLLLQSLHEHFPEAIFFTTDLDARLFHAKQLKWTRNLIVATSYGLKLNESLQSKVAPFRDGYQSAKFLACLTALGTTNQIKNSDLQPRLFEIGRFGPVDLSAPKPSSSLHPLPRSSATDIVEIVARAAFVFFVGWALVLAMFPKSRSVIGQYFVHDMLANAIVVTTGLAVSAVCVWKGLPRYFGFVAFGGVLTVGWFNAKSNLLTLRHPLTASAKAFAASFVFVAVALSAMTALIVTNSNKTDGQPFAWLDGISLWPTEVIRVIAIVFGVAMLAKMRFDLQRETRKTKDEFGLPPTATQRGAWQRLLKLHEWPTFSIGGWHSKAVSGDAIDANVLWAEYADRGCELFRYARAARTVVVAFAFAASLLLLLPIPVLPHRGDFSRIFDVSTLVCCIVVLFLVTFYVSDASHLCGKCISILNKHRTLWPRNGMVTPDQAMLEGTADLLDIRFIARRTAEVGKMIYYPFLIIVLLLVARNAMFAAWHWSLYLYIIFGLNIGYAFLAAVRLRQIAEKARKLALKRLREKELQAIASKAKSFKLDYLRNCITQVEEENTGAFAPLFHQPIFKAALMPFGGAGVVTALQYMLGV